MQRHAPLATELDDLAVVSTGTIRRLGSGGPLVSVILPVKNRAGNLVPLLARLFEQRCDVDLELIAVDSGSDDASVAILSSAGATVLTTPADRFSYGLTRTAAARVAGGSILVFVTSTVLPLDDRWLRELLTPFADARVAGAFSRSIPRTDADLLTRRDYLRADLLAYRTCEATVIGQSEIREITDWDRYRSLPAIERRRFISFSNNAAAIRASIFEQIPFRDHHICEDMLWAQEALEAGHKIVYQRSSIVLYSHCYDAIDLFGRCFDGGVFFNESSGVATTADEVIPNTFQMVLDDWRYLAERPELQSAALEHQRATSVVRRTAEAIGQWLGTQHRQLQDLRVLRELFRALPTTPPADGVEQGSQPYGAAAVAAFDRGLAEGALNTDLAGIERELLDAIVAGWRGMAAQPAVVRIDTAVRATLEGAAFWFGRLWSDVEGRPLAEVFSLIARLRRSGKTLEMRRDADPAAGDRTRADWNQRVDGAALLLAIDALQAEYLAAHRELHLRAGAIATLGADVVARDATIRSLQTELFDKVGERDRQIRDLQQEMHAKVAECNAIIAGLQKGR